MENAQITIVVLAGGFSSEHQISVASGKTAYNAFKEAGFHTLLVLLTKEGLFLDDKKVHLGELGAHYVFNSIHGDPGENGHMSGFLEVLNIPHSTCRTFESALTFNKAQCNQLLRLDGFNVPKGELFNDFPGEDYFAQWQLPLFVKPNCSGSSFGVTKVEKYADIESAFTYAQSEGGPILVEEGVQGVEVGCGVLSTHHHFETAAKNSQSTPQAIAITEIVPTEAGFFDYEAKYEGKSQEITPARIDVDLAQKISAISEKVYTYLNLRGIVRIDYIIDKSQNPVLIEVNSIPGLSPASIVPQQLAYRGWSLSQVLETMVHEALAQ